MLVCLVVCCRCLVVCCRWSTDHPGESNRWLERLECFYFENSFSEERSNDPNQKCIPKKYFTFAYVLHIELSCSYSNHTEGVCKHEKNVNCAMSSSHIQVIKSWEKKMR